MPHQNNSRKNWPFGIFALVALLVTLGLSASIAMAGLPTSAPTGTVAQQVAYPPVQTVGNGMITSPETHHDTSPPLRDILPVVSKPQNEHEGNANPHMYLNLHQNVKDQVVQNTLSPLAMPTPILNFDGIGFPGVNCNCAPPDTDGEVGATQYVQMVNKGYQVFNKATGASVYGPVDIATIWSGFGGACQNGGFGDPVVLYDQLANRWLISQFASPTGNTPITDECIAISQTSDAIGAYYRYGFHLGANFYDYPHLSVWPDAYYMSDNVFNAQGTAYLGPQPFAFDRTRMLAGLSATFISTASPIGPTFNPILPADIDGTNLPTAGAPVSFVEFPGQTTPVYKTYHFHVDFTTPANSTFALYASPAAAGYTTLCGSTRSCVPELGGSGLDGIGDRLMFRLAYRMFSDGHEALVGNYTVSSGGVAGIRWFELRGVTAGPETVFQESTYQPDTTWRWMGSAAMDNQGNLALGFSASSSSIFPQIRYAGRLATDPINTLAQGEATLYSGTGSQLSTGNRWGDYSDMTIDPVDECTFWYTQEYYLTTAAYAWHTRIGNFKFPTCTNGGGVPTSTSTPVAPTATSTTVPPTATRTNTVAPPTSTTTNTATITSTSTSTSTTASTSTGTATATTTSTATASTTNTATASATVTGTNTVIAGTATATACSSTQSFSGSIDTTDPVATQRLFRAANTTACGVTNTCPGTSGTAPFHYDTYTFTNTSGAPACVTAVLTGGASQTDTVQLEVYLNAFDPANACSVNYLADGGLSAGAGISTQASFTIPAGATVVIVVLDPVGSGAAGGAYTLDVSGLPCTGTATATTTATTIPATLTTTNTTVPVTATQINTSTSTSTRTASVTITASRTATGVPPTSTRTATTVPATSTSTSMPSNTAVASTTNTSTTVVPSSTRTVVPTSTRTNTAVSTSTVAASSTRTYTAFPTTTTIPSSTTVSTSTVLATGTATRTGIAPATGTATTVASGTATTTGTATAEPTSTVCPIQFADVLPGSDFYPYIRCLVCRNIVSGYQCGGPGEPCNANGDGYFRPFASITRGQIAKMVSNSAGFEDDPGPQIYTDVPTTQPFFPFINRLTNHNVMSGYPCGGPNEPCDSQSRSYFRPGANATRGQVSKIVANAAGITDPVPAGTQTYTDVPSTNAFYLYIERLTARGVMGGYACGGPGEPCDAQQRPYFRPFATITRSQTAKIVANTFFPNCQTPVK